MSGMGREAQHEVIPDIVVIGASAGGVTALADLVAKLPRDLPAALFVVVHVPSGAASNLPQILSRVGPIPAVTARDNARIERGKIYAAPPDYHLLLTRDQMRVAHGPRENRHRPAIDPLFRSAALNLGARVIGVILSGALNDGTAGLLAIKWAGGVAMVQDPATAAFAGMPESALADVPIDWCLPVDGLAETIVSLCTTELVKGEKIPTQVETMDEAQKSEMEYETDIAGLDSTVVTSPEHYGRLSSLTCPDCHGPLWEIQDGPLFRFRCRVGHAFTAESVLEGHDDTIEEALWMALNTLEESRQLHERLEVQAKARNHTYMASQLRRKIRDIDRRATTLRNLLVPELKDEGQPGAAAGGA